MNDCQIRLTAAIFTKDADVLTAIGCAAGNR